GFTTSVTNGSADLVTSGGVYTAISNLNLPNTYAAKTHAHTLGQIIYDGTTGYAAGTTISSDSTDGQLATAKAVYDYVVSLNLGTTYAAKSHTHAAGDINSGTLAAARLPNATTSAKGGVIVGAGLSVSNGTISVDYATCKTGLGLGSAAYLSTGTGSGNIPVLDAAGKLPVSMMPARVIGGEYLGEVSNQAGMIAKSNATVGDFVKRTDKGTYWMLGVDGDNAYATAANWFEYAGAVASVNGKVGTVTLTIGDIYAVSGTKLTLVAMTNGDTYQFWTGSKIADYVGNAITTAIAPGGSLSIESSQIQDMYTSANEAIGNAAFGEGGYAASDIAVAEYVTGAISNLNLANTYAPKTHNHAASAITSGTLDKARLPAADATNQGAVILAKAATSGTTDTTNDTKAVTPKAAKQIADAAIPKAKIFTITGDGSATDFTCTHGLGVSNVLVQVYDSAGNQVWVAVTKTTTAVTFKFAAAPASGTTYTAVIFGVTAAS
ncbi:MAG: hypothetical protein IKE69_12490, partial [Thermoguttaceae bacterium]|nr:hypothetical protein [Thermoguttaceae bacterium]